MIGKGFVIGLGLVLYAEVEPQSIIVPHWFILFYITLSKTSPPTWSK